MPTVLLLVMFLVLPGLLGFVAHYSNLSRIKVLVRKRRAISFADLLAVLIYGSTLDLILSGSAVLLELPTSPTLSLALFVIPSIAVFGLAMIEVNVAERVKRHGTTCAVLLGAVTFLVILVTEIYVDAEIVSRTRLNASLFPGGQKALMLVISPVFWFVALILIAVPLYFYYAVKIIVALFRESKVIDRFCRACAIIFGWKDRGGALQDPLFRNLALMVGFLIFLMGTVNVTFSFLSGQVFQNFVSDVFVWSSYHADGKSCTNIGRDGLEYRVSFLEPDEISITTKMGNGEYHFAKSVCDRKDEALLQ